MAYFGKEFTFEREDNFDALIKALELKEDEAKGLAAWKPNQKIEKDGDTYKITYITANGETTVNSFQDGVTFDEEIHPGATAKTIYNVDGDTVTQVQDFGPQGTMKVKREYSENGLKVTISSSKWDGAAYRYYTPV